jgi:hypothetical protein
MIDFNALAKALSSMVIRSLLRAIGAMIGLAFEKLLPIGDVLQGVSAQFAEIISQFVSCNREEVGLQVPFLIVIRQTVQEANKGFLNDVFRLRTVAETTAGKCQEATFVPVDQPLPGIGITRTDFLHQKFIAFRSHRPTPLQLNRVAAIHHYSPSLADDERKSCEKRC